MTNQQRQEFADLFTDSYQRIYGYIYALLLDIHETDDVMQQVSLVMWEKFEQFQPGTNFSAWACQIARYKVMDINKSKTRSKLIFGDALQTALARAVQEFDDSDDRRNEALAECISKLRSEDRDLVMRAYGEGVAATELAEQLNRPLTSVHNSIRRIRRALVTCITRVMGREGRA